MRNRYPSVALHRTAKVGPRLFREIKAPCTFFLFFFFFALSAAQARQQEVSDAAFRRNRENKYLEAYNDANDDGIITPRERKYRGCFDTPNNGGEMYKKGKFTRSIDNLFAYINVCVNQDINAHVSLHWEGVDFSDRKTCTCFLASQLFVRAICFP